MQINILKETDFEGAFVPGRFDVAPTLHPCKQKMQQYSEFFLNHKRKLTN